MNGHTEPHAGSPSPPPGVPVSEFDFTLPDLPDVRHFAETQARKAGLREETVTDLVIAVNEVATNAVTHGTPTAHLRTWADGADLVLEIHDHGRWRGGAFGRERPAPQATHGMGLWVARLLATTVTFRTGAGGSTVVLTFAGDR